MRQIAVEKAYEHCRRVTCTHAKSFYFCAHFLPREKRRAIFAVYALCRSVDDTIDLAEAGGEEVRLQAIGIWQNRLRDVFAGQDSFVELSIANERKPESNFHLVTHQDTTDVVNQSYTDDCELILIAWRDLLRVYKIPLELPLEIMRGVLMDTHTNRYESWDELRVYCYRVASVVGLISAEIFGYTRPETLRYAESLGLAMQLTNILRDVGEDALMNRIYLPQEDLRRFGVAENELRAGAMSERFRGLMKFEIERAREFYREAERGIPLLEADTRFTVLLAARLYARILDQIERQNYNVFLNRAHLSFAGKLRATPRIWREARSM